MQKTISIVIPVYNEEANVPLICDAVRGVFLTLPHLNSEIIFVNDGSQDATQKAINALQEQDPSIVSVEFTRNFGKESANTAGIRMAAGDAVIVIDADLQHPPSLIAEFITRWEQGAEVVIGVRRKNHKEGVIKRWGSRLYYAVMNLIAETKMVPGETDFRLIDRSVAEAFNKLTEHGRMTRSLINWLGFKQEFISFTAPARMHGEAGYSILKLTRLAIHSAASHSMLPLRLAGYLGLLITLFSGLLGVTVFVEKYLLNDSFRWNVSSNTQLVLVNLFLVGITLMALGLIALYVERINQEVSGRPLYVVRDSQKRI